jgi:hypothetical protein
MSESNSSTSATAPPAPVTRTSRPLSEALLNDKVCVKYSIGLIAVVASVAPIHLYNTQDFVMQPSPPCSHVNEMMLITSCLQWDRCLSSLIIKSGLGLSFGIIFSMLLFKRRAWPLWLGTGFGAGRAVEECDQVHNSTNVIYGESSNQWI